MKLLCVVILAGLCCITAQAEDWTVAGKDYHNVTVGKVEPDRVHISYDGGIGTVMLSDLTPELQKRFGYDPVAAQKQASSIQANGSFQNGDFSDGATYWQGDGETPRAYAERNPAALTDPLTSKGLIVTLNSTSWTRIFQSFPSDKGTQYSILVTYKLSPNLALSKDAADYAEISKRIQIPGFENFGSMTIQPGQFYGTLGEPSSTTIAMEVFSPKLGSSEVQTYQHTYPPIPVSGNKTVALAFPPGAGTVVILSVAVTSNLSQRPPKSY